MLNDSAASQLARQIQPLQAVYAQNLSAVQPLIENMRRLAPVIEMQTPAMEAVRQLVESASSIINVQQMNTEILRGITESVQMPAIEAFTRQNNVLLSEAIDNMLAIRQSEMARITENISSSLDMRSIVDNVASVSRAYDTWFRGIVASSVPVSAALPSRQVEAHLALPTLAFTRYTRGTRDLIDADTQVDSLDVPVEDNSVHDGDELDQMLHRLNPEFVEMRRGSWSALQSRRPDYLRHAGTSQRELIRQVLEHLVPTDQLPEDQRDGAQIKPRIKILLSGSNSDVEFVDSMAKALVNYYRQLNKYTHHNQKHEASLRCVLLAGEAILLFVLVNVIDR